MQAAMMYDRGPSDIRWALLYMVERGVTLDFALRVFATPREDMRWPKRSEMQEAGLVAKYLELCCTNFPTREPSK